jgi:hypothetical protein
MESYSFCITVAKLLYGLPLPSRNRSPARPTQTFRQLATPAGGHINSYTRHHTFPRRDNTYPLFLVSAPDLTRYLRIGPLRSRHAPATTPPKPVLSRHRDRIFHRHQYPDPVGRPTAYRRLSPHIGYRLRPSPLLLLSIHHTGITIPDLPESRFLYWTHINQVEATNDSIHITTADHKPLHFRLRNNLSFDQMEHIQAFCRFYLGV